MSVTAFVKERQSCFRQTVSKGAWCSRWSIDSGPLYLHWWLKLSHVLQIHKCKIGLFVLRSIIPVFLWGWGWGCMLKKEQFQIQKIEAIMEFLVKFSSLKQYKAIMQVVQKICHKNFFLSTINIIVYIKTVYSTLFYFVYNISQQEN